MVMAGPPRNAVGWVAEERGGVAPVLCPRWYCRQQEMHEAGRSDGRYSRNPPEAENGSEICR